jgi:hypothetical protein
MYDPKSGRGYDGINSYVEVNRNSGAESTIEALFSVNRLESNTASKKKLFDLYKRLK